MVDFSCALKLAMPLAVLSAMREAGRAHITVKGGKFLEAVAAADTIVFDKTGTLTHACPRVAQVVSFGGKEESEMLRLAACLEEHFPHSMANAVVEGGQAPGPAPRGVPLQGGVSGGSRQSQAPSMRSESSSAAPTSSLRMRAASFRRANRIALTPCRRSILTCTWP